MGWGWHGWYMGWMWVFWIALIFLIVWLLVRAGRTSNQPAQHGESNGATPTAKSAKDCQRMLNEIRR